MINIIDITLQVCGLIFIGIGFILLFGLSLLLFYDLFKELKARFK